MIEDSIIGQTEGIQILENFFEKKCCFDKLAELYKPKKRSKESLMNYVKNKIKQILFSIEQVLFRAKIIKEVIFIDQQSKELFDQLSKMDQYFPQNLFSDFIFEEKSKYLKIQKSKMNKKRQMYQIFLKYATEKHLLTSRFSLQIKQGLYQFANQIYLENQLEILCILYQIHEGDYQKISNSLRNQQQKRFQKQLIVANLKNIQLIGLYKIYLKCVKAGDINAKTWNKFIEDVEMLQDLIQKMPSDLKVILVQTAIRNNVLPFQIREISLRIGYRYQQITQIQLQKPKMNENNQKKNNSQHINSLRQSLQSILNRKVTYKRDQ